MLGRNAVQIARRTRVVNGQQSIGAKRWIRPAGTPPSGDSTRGLHSSGNLPMTAALIAATGATLYYFFVRNPSGEQLSAASGRPGESNIRSASESAGTAKATGGPAKGSNGHGEGASAKEKFENSVQMTRSGAYEGDRDARGQGAVGSGHKG